LQNFKSTYQNRYSPRAPRRTESAYHSTQLFTIYKLGYKYPNTYTNIKTYQPRLHQYKWKCSGSGMIPSAG